MRVVSAEVREPQPVSEQATFSMRTVNRSGKPLALHTTALEVAFDVIVRDRDGDVVWRLRSLPVALGPATTFLFQPGQEDLWTAVWDLEDLEDQPVRDGTYWMIGSYGKYSLRFQGVESDPVRVEVRR